MRGTQPSTPHIWGSLHDLKPLLGIQPYYSDCRLQSIANSPSITAYGGERGIRTLETVILFTRFPGELLQPLGHLSTCSDNNFTLSKKICQADIRHKKSSGYPELKILPLLILLHWKVPLFPYCPVQLQDFPCHLYPLPLQYS